MVMLKVLQQYYSATGDERVIELMSAYFRYQLRELPKTPLGHWTFWGEQRGGDNLGIVYWLYNITGDEFLLELGDLIHRQTFDWTGILAGGEVIPTPFSLHCVNLAQGIKEPGGLLPAQQRPGACGGREERLRGHTPLHRPADRGCTGATRRCTAPPRRRVRSFARPWR